MTTIQPFRIDIPTAVLDDLQQRLKNTRWLPPSKADANWDHGTNMDYLKELVDYWQHSYHWEQHGEKVK
jgi:Epoxide hydrolase N terminus